MQQRDSADHERTDQGAAGAGIEDAQSRDTASHRWSALGKCAGLKRREMTQHEHSHVTRGRRLNKKNATFANSRGDVQSTTASLHAALGVRLYLLTEFVLSHNLSSASWPARGGTRHR